MEFSGRKLMYDYSYTSTEFRTLKVTKKTQLTETAIETDRVRQAQARCIPSHRFFHLHK
jgi:hypothetical protein